MDEYIESSKLITVLMSVYNTDVKYLKEAINSILSQTYNNWELIIVDDGSTQNIKNILSEYKNKDQRIRIITLTTNIGLTKALNIGLEDSCGDYIARLDSDDVALPHRLEVQLRYMENHPQIAVLGSAAIIKGKGKCKTSFMPNEWRKVQLLTSNCGPIHSSSFIDAKFLRINNIKYDESKKRAQDYKLWMDIENKNGRIEILKEKLIIHRLSENSISNRYRSEQKRFAKLISAETMSLMTKNIDKYAWLDLLNGQNNELLVDAFKHVIRANKINKKYNEVLLCEELKYLEHKITKNRIPVSTEYVLYRIGRAIARMEREIPKFIIRKLQ